MSEHTPTTEEVRAYYAGERWCIDQQFRRDALAEFDRWLNRTSPAPSSPS